MGVSRAQPGDRPCVPCVGSEFADVPDHHAPSPVAGDGNGLLVLDSVPRIPRYAPPSGLSPVLRHRDLGPLEGATRWAGCEGCAARAMCSVWPSIELHVLSRALAVRHPRGHSAELAAASGLQDPSWLAHRVHSLAFDGACQRCSAAESGGRGDAKQTANVSAANPWPAGM